MKLHGETVNVGDRVFDITTNRGYGTVVSVKNSSFEVKFQTLSAIYNKDGIQNGRPWRTLFWDKPLIVNPMKDEGSSARKHEMVKTMFDLLKEYQGLV